MIEGGTTIPRYDFQCEAGDGHVFEKVARHETTWVLCPIHKECSHRLAIQSGIGVIFKGEGFTKSVVVPGAPAPESTAKLTTDERMEVLDDFAKENHVYDENVLPYAKEAETSRDR